MPWIKKHSVSIISHYNRCCILNIAGNDTDTVTIHINLDDANDSPKFNSSTYNASVEENQPSGVFVYRVYATDIDQQQGNRLFSYALHESFNKFKINSQTGRITTTGRKNIDNRECTP